MQLNHIKTSSYSAVRSFDEIFLELVNLLDAHAARRGVMLVEGFSAGSYDVVGPAVDFLCCCGAGAEPGGYTAGFAACVGELDGDVGVLAVCKVDVFAECVDVGVEPDTSVP
ncbi:hypothetical protein HG531_011242 [Fusarium graminearum]|nr:hypothetical protein HG531_011242 [Fusarium graminearum]